VRYSVDRQRNEESPKSALFYRQFQWETVDKIEVGPDPLQLTITTKDPVAPFIDYLADTHAVIIPREVVDPARDDMNSADKMIGTGPFMLDKFVALQSVKCVRNPTWFARRTADNGLPNRPIVDGYEALWNPEDLLGAGSLQQQQIDAYLSFGQDPCGVCDPGTGGGVRSAAREWHHQ
jgi:ABC-type transport system substrate-binding protein